MPNQDHSARYLFSDAIPQTRYNSEDIAIRNLFNDRTIYDNYPSFQRGYVWPDKFKRLLIDSILRNFPIHPLLAYKEMDEDGEQKYYIVDGKQRLSTIYAFMEGRFLTASGDISREEARAFPIIEPRRRYPELSDRARNVFSSYTFSINLIDGTDKQNVAALFRRIQHQLPLRASDRLASFTSTANDFARRLQDNPIWEFYRGANANRQVQQANLMLLALELAQGYTSCKSTSLDVLASGTQDKYLTPALYEAIESRLEIVEHVFSGSAFTIRTAIIPMYLAVMFLQKQGITFTSSDKGCFTDWLARVLYEADSTGIRGFSNPIATLQNVNRQQEFWQLHLPRLIEIYKGNSGQAA